MKYYWSIIFLKNSDSHGRKLVCSSRPLKKEVWLCIKRAPSILEKTLKNCIMNINCLSLLYLAAFPLKPMIILRGATSVTQELSLLMIHFWPIPTLSPVYHFPGHTVPCEAVPVSALSAVSQAPFSACQGAMQDYRFSKECHCHPELPQQSCSLSCCQNRGTAWFGTPWSSLEIEETWTSLGDSWKKKKNLSKNFPL